MKVFLSSILLLSLTACVQAGAVTPPADQPTQQKHTKVLVLNQADGQSLQWHSGQTAAELEQALAALPAEKASRVRQLIEQIQQQKDGDPQIFFNMLSDDDAVAGKLPGDKIRIHKIVAGKGQEFALLKQLVAQGQFDKKQLQELQQLLDSKH